MGAAVGAGPLVVPAGSEEGCRVVLLRSGLAVAVCTRQGGGRSQLLSMWSRHSRGAVNLHSSVCEVGVEILWLALFQIG